MIEHAYLLGSSTQLFESLALFNVCVTENVFGSQSPGAQLVFSNRHHVAKKSCSKFRRHGCV